jgi:hypothetical protein
MTAVFIASGGGPGASRARGRAAWAAALSLVLHVLILTGMVIGLKVLKPPAEERAVELQLIRPFERQPPPEPVPQPARKAITAPTVRARITPQPSPEGAPPAAEPAAPPPAPPAAKPQVAGPPEGGVKPSVSGRMGCDDPLGIHLNDQQYQSCANNLAKLGRDAKPLDLNISASKKREYDRVARHQEACREKDVPQMNPDTNPKAPRNPNPSSINPYYGAGAGMGQGGSCP